ncbi:MAG: hypothetical protein ACREDW_09770 [Aestuariivirgaceae bacterium]
MNRLFIILVLGASLTVAAAKPSVAQTSQEEPLGEAEEYETVPAEAVPLQKVELTDDIARKAIDAFMLIEQKYPETFGYTSYEDFVAKDKAGKAFESDIKSLGFSTVTEWKAAIDTVGDTYQIISEGSGQDIESQIEEVKADKTLPQAEKDRIVSSLTPFIQSENNKKVVALLLKDPIYGEKLRLLAEEE